MKAEQPRVEIRDQKNPERLLGTIGRLGCALQTPFIEMAVTNANWRPTLDPYAPFEEPYYTRISFAVKYRKTEGGWAKVAELHTDAPLGVLLWMPEFHLPGESRQQAQYRRDGQRYGL